VKKVILLLCFIMLSANVSFADSCFIAKENGKVLKSEGDCEKRYAPMSTFKIALSLIGFDSGILMDEMHPVFGIAKF
jgi:beta-lactamase class D